MDAKCLSQYSVFKFLKLRDLGRYTPVQELYIVSTIVKTLFHSAPWHLVMPPQGATIYFSLTQSTISFLSQSQPSEL